MKMITEKKLLSDCGECLVIDDTDPKDPYIIKIACNKFLVLQIGGGIHKAISKFTHPNIIHSRKEIYELKHYRQGGGKFWTSQAGVSHYLIIPADKIYILPEKGYSWIPAEINGVKVHFNVSGGGGSDGWTDYLGGFTSTSINHKVADIKKIAEVAIKDEEVIQELLKRLDAMDKDSIHDRPAELAKWDKLYAKASPDTKKNKEKLLQIIEGKGVNVKIILRDGYTEKEGIASYINRCGKKEMVTETSWQYNMRKGRCKNVIVNFGNGYPKRVRDSQIDWVATVKENAELLNKKCKVVVDNAVMV